MPAYDYECENCGHIFEVSQKMSDKPLKKCPECKGKLTRLIGGGTGVIVKGGDSSCRDDVCALKDSPCCPGGKCPGSR